MSSISTMEYRPLNITVMSAEGIKNVKMFTKMDVCTVVKLVGYPKSKKKTFVDKDCGTEPKWNYRMEFIVDEPCLTVPGLSLIFKLKAEMKIGRDKMIGSVTVPIHDLYHNHPSPTDGEDKVVEYQLCTRNNRAKGILKFSYSFGAKFTQQVDKKKQGNQPAASYQFGAAGGYTGSSPSPYDPRMGYPPLNPPPFYVSYGQATPPWYGMNPPMAYGQALPPGYGYQAPPPGYGYPAPPSGHGYQQAQSTHVQGYALDPVKCAQGRDVDPTACGGSPTCEKPFGSAKGLLVSESDNASTSGCGSGDAGEDRGIRTS